MSYKERSQRAGFGARYARTRDQCLEVLARVARYVQTSRLSLFLTAVVDHESSY